MEHDGSYIFFYSLGTVLAGYLMALPFWAVVSLWNRCLPKRAFNPWILSLVAMLGIYLCFTIVILHLHQGDLNTAIVVLGLLPGTVWCGVGARRYHRAQNAEPELL